MTAVTISEARDAMLLAFKTAWADETPVAWQNVAFNADASTVTEFVRASVSHNSGTQAGLGGVGSRTFRRGGIFTVQIFVAADKGTERGDELAQMVLELLQAATLGPAWLRDPTVVEVGQDGKWWQVNVSATFQYDSTD